MKTKVLLALLACGPALIPSAPLAQDAPATGDKVAEAKAPMEVQKPDGPAGDKWRFSVVPLAWLSAINGNVTLRGKQTDVNLNFDRIFQHTDGAFMAYLEARNDKFGFYAQPSYMKLSGDGNAGPLQGNLTLKMWVAEAGGLYQLGKWGEEKPLQVDVFAGVRYWGLDTDIDLHGQHGLIDFSGSSTIDLYDPLIGLSVQKHLTEGLSVVVRGDIGGFGASNSSSDFSWQAIALVGYDFTKHFTAFAGYRALALRKEDGSGSGKHGVDLVMNGALLGFNFTF
jgi:hypothetical protein